MLESWKREKRWRRQTIEGILLDRDTSSDESLLGRLRKLGGEVFPLRGGDGRSGHFDGFVRKRQWALGRGSEDDDGRMVFALPSCISFCSFVGPDRGWS
jgi:hypothetical protein